MMHHTDVEQHVSHPLLVSELPIDHERLIKCGKGVGEIAGGAIEQAENLE
jgi:hypothetical protein